MQSDLLLEVKDLKTYFYLDDGIVRAVDGASFALRRSSTLGVVGESGCGKSVTAYSILKLVSRPGRIVGGSILYHRHTGGRDEVVDLAKLPSDGDVIRSIRGAEIAMIFQEPMTSFSPVHSIGYQISKVLELHQQMNEKQARERTAELLSLVGIPRPRERLDAYPFQLSGGMRQRAMIAMSLSCSPSLLVADEPTTALDVTTQAQIMDLLRKLQADLGMAVMLITHNLGVVMEMCREVIVMYLGEVVEHASVRQLFKEPAHPYTQALFRSIPHLTQQRGVRLDPIEGAVPDAYNRPQGCPFHPRCKQIMVGKCDTRQPGLVTLDGGRRVRCFLYGEGV
jgi:peptide/nickel transport system ATP-binding protein